MSDRCKRSASTEIEISQNEIPREISKPNKLKPNRKMPEVCCSRNNNNILKTDKNKLNTPKSCMLRINVKRKFKFLISSKVVLRSSSSYDFFKDRTMVAMVKKRLVYANKISEVAENKSAGVSMDSIISLLDKKNGQNVGK